MTTEKFNIYKEKYRTALIEDVIPFWQKNSIDNNLGGYFTSLDRFGNVFDKDKFVWLQARQMWTFSMLYNKYDKNQEWLDVAKVGFNFLENNGMDKEGNWYFALNQEGKPLVQPYNIFSDCFASMAFGEFALASGDGKSKEIALQTYRNILKRKDNPKGTYTKAIGETRNLKSFSLPMILANLTLELKWMLGEEEFKKYSVIFLDEIMNHFLDNKKGIIHENVFPNGDKSDTYEGRLINPGHGIEGMSFVIDVAAELGENEIIKRATDIILSILEFSWDEEFGGIFYFMDSEGKPPLALEWDQKLWWVHLETLVALLNGFYHTQDKRLWDWFEKLHRYTWEHFPDEKYGEWFGYLNREGKVLIPLKGGKWKGAFHVPRGLYQCYRKLDLLANSSNG